MDRKSWILEYRKARLVVPFCTAYALRFGGSLSLLDDVAPAAFLAVLRATRRDPLSAPMTSAPHRRVFLIFTPASRVLP